MADEALVAAFMAATGCGREDAFVRLASSGGHLGRAVNRFFSIDAGPSGTGSGRRRSPPPPPPQASVSESSSESEEDAVRARPVPASRTRVSRWDSETRVGSSGGGAHRRSPSGSGSGRSSTRVSRWDSVTRVGRSKSSRRRERRRRRRDRFRESGSGTPRGNREADGGNHNRRRRRRFREDIFSDGEEDEKTNNSSRRRLNPTELTSEGEKKKAAADDNNSSRRFREDAIIVSSDDDDDDDNMLYELEEAPRPAPAPPAPNRTFEELFKVPHELTFKGGFHAAKAHAARRARWLLANVQSFDLPLPSLHQNRDVWGNGLVARCVLDRFVLWQADAAAPADDDDDGGQGEEAKKVLAYYNIPHDMLPVVVVVDPVTGQAMDVLHGSAAYDLNDFMVRLGPYTDTEPDIPGKSIISASLAGAQSNNTRPATTSMATSPTSSERAAAGSRQQQAPTTTVTTKPPDAVVAAVAVAPTTCQTRQEQAPPMAATKPVKLPESVEEKVCKVRVRLADGRVVTKEFGSQCAVAALFAYCRSMLGAGGGAPERPFRLLRFVGRATEEIGDQNASFESLGLHLTTVSVHLG